MKEKFENNKKEDDFKEEEYERAFYDLVLESLMSIFEKIKKYDEKIADFLKNDYEEFIRLMGEYFQKNKTVYGSFNYIKNKNSQNVWLEVIQNIAQNYEHTKEGILDVYNALREKIEKKKKGTDIQ